LDFFRQIKVSNKHYNIFTLYVEDNKPIILCVTYFVTSITARDPRSCDMGHRLEVISAFPCLLASVCLSSAYVCIFRFI